MPTLPDIFRFKQERMKALDAGRLMKDKFGREINYMRISVTDRCNLNCIYCMPDKLCSPAETMSLDEIIKIAKAAAVCGVKRIRFTGGEPLVRNDTVEMIEEIKKIKGIEKTDLTTNGILLGQYIDKLAKIGLDSVSISLDTLDREKYERITGKDSLYTVTEAVKMAQALGNIDVKINSVILRGINDDQVCRLASLADEESTSIRFIELMPIGFGRDYSSIPQGDILKMLEAQYGEAVPCKESRTDLRYDSEDNTEKRNRKTDKGAKGKVREKISGEISGPSVYYKFSGLAGKIGFISPLSHKFCSSCNRIRITSEGMLRLCLHSERGVDLKQALKRGAEEKELAAIMKKAVSDKPLSHEFDEAARRLLSEEKTMVQIGG